MELRRILAGGFMVVMGTIAMGACGSSITSRCKTICDNEAKCGQTNCTCNGSSDCSNTEEILSYLEDCTSKPCDQQFKLSGVTPSGCLTTIPACKH